MTEGMIGLHPQGRSAAEDGDERLLCFAMQWRAAPAEKSRAQPLQEGDHLSVRSANERGRWSRSRSGTRRRRFGRHWSGREIRDAGEIIEASASNLGVACPSDRWPNQCPYRARVCIWPGSGAPSPPRQEAREPRGLENTVYAGLQNRSSDNEVPSPTGLRRRYRTINFDA